MDQSGTLVFLLFLPLLWVVWLAVILLLLQWGIWDADASIWLVDDYKQTCYHISHVTDILQLSSNGLLCKRSQFSSEVVNRTL
jgi:hypothetical protein